jgi:hypothetical protein
VTKKKKASENEKRLNLTAHQRAMTNPEVQEIFNGLRACWKDLSPQQRCEKLSVLIGFECSGRGIAKELGESESNIRRYIAKANPLEEGNDWATMMKSTLAKEPQKQGTKSASEDVRRIPSKIPAKKQAEPVIKETYPMQDQARTSTAQQTKKISYPSSTAVKEPPVVSGATSGLENQLGEDSPGKKRAGAILKTWRDRQDRLKRLASISDEIKPRPLVDAHSIGRQGGPLPPKDRH